MQYNNRVVSSFQNKRYEQQKKQNSHFIIYLAATISVFFALAFSFFFAVKLNIFDPFSFENPRIAFADFLPSELSDSFAASKEKEEPKLDPVPEFIGEEMITGEEFDAVSIAVRDVESGKILFEKNADEERPIASITKLMSALTVLEREIDWESSATVTRDDLADTHMYAGDSYTLDELWNASLIASSNKAIYTLAEAVGLSEEAFIARMNQKTLEIGMEHSYFVEPTGLDPENVSTAKELLKLLAAALEHEEIANALLTRDINLYSDVRAEKHHTWNTNWLLLGWIENPFEKFLGGKTGYIPEAGYNFSMRVEDEKGRQVDVIVLGASVHEARFVSARDAALWVFENYKWPGEDDIIEDAEMVEVASEVEL